MMKMTGQLYRGRMRTAAVIISPPHLLWRSCLVIYHLVFPAFKDIKNDISKDVLLSFAKSDDAQVRYTTYKSLSAHEIDSELLNQYEDAIYNEEKRHIVETILVNMSKQKNNEDVKDIARDYVDQCPTEKLCKLAQSIL